MNIDKLKKVIQKANPSILELKLGCEVEINKEKGLILRKYPISPSLSDKQSTYDIWLKDSCNLVENYFSNFKILGRPITLHDIRLTLIKHKNDWGDCFREVSSMWNESNNLDDQSEALKSLLTRWLVIDL